MATHLDRKTHTYKRTTEHYQLWTDLPRAQTATLLKQDGIIMTENRTKGSKHPQKTLEFLLTSLENYS